MNPRRSNSSLPKPGRSAYGVASAVVLLLIPVVVLVGGSQFQEFLNFGAGVLSLVSLSCSVIWGLVAQDRILLNIRQRIVGQAIHRTTAVASIAFLLLHITTKIALDHTVVIAALIPFSLGFTGSGGLIGLGSLAGLLMIFVGVTGALRSNFATPAPVAARWRAMHMLAYPAWCAALVHGLYAGRAAKPIFTILYSLSLLGVMAALALRAAPRPVKRKLSDRVMALLGNSNRPGMEELEASRNRVAESGVRDREPRRGGGGPGAGSGGLYQSPAAGAGGAGFAAAYRTAGPPQQQYPGVRQDTPDMRPTEAMPRVNDPSGPSWPVPSPPPVGEAPPSAYDPLQDTGYSIPVYGNPGTPGGGGGDVRNTGETNARYGTYNSSETFNSGPATEPTPGASFDAPGSGEPWNMPSGGYR
ncbi:cytochrome b/b6 domain-containing protein [Streptomyces sp. DSM 110735]|uniref:cytochrome b/b6 domain-containing protein n=1 Tax=Streptomyces sp. DSM 110735 TaxID=2775031 RepID=UPI0018F50D72|nr:cytochrome b/b6 domain-containing protein [Streptomyces sp. DSM 110735]MBJ7903660.1 cytochrome b/b6 domain-containing protein [Streptomyces sp. DSM 110735]